MNLLLCGAESGLTELYRRLWKGHHRIGGVIAFLEQGELPGVVRHARQAGAKVWPMTRLKDPHLASEVQKECFDVLLNIRCPYIVPDSLLNVVHYGGFNLHTGRLPEYAGLNVANWAIYNGEAMHGYTIHEMTSRIDGGRVAIQERFPIPGDITAGALVQRCIRMGVEGFNRLLEHLERDGIPPLIEQDLTQRRYYSRGIPQNGRISWQQMAAEIERFVRACDHRPFASPWGWPQAKLGSMDVGVVKARLSGERVTQLPGFVREAGRSGIQVACQDEWLDVQRLQVGSSMIEARELFHAGNRIVNTLQ